MPVLGTPAAPGGIVPTPYEGLKTILAGNSYSVGTGSSNFTGHFQRLVPRLNLKSVLSLGVGGTPSTLAAKVVLNGAGALPALQGTGGEQWLLMVDAVVTDYLYTGNSPEQKAREKTRNSIAAMLAGVRGTSNIFNNSGSVTLTGTWASAADTEAPPNNTSASTTTQNDTATIAGLAAGSRVAVMLHGIDDSANGTAGAAYSIAAGNGTVLATGTTSNHHKAGNGAANRALMPVFVTLPAGQTSLVVKKTDANGSVLYFVGAYPQAATNAGPSHVLICKALKIPGATTQGIGYYNDAIDQAVLDAGYGTRDPGVLVWDPNSVTEFNPATMIDAPQVHPNDRGYALLADKLLSFISANATYGIPRNLDTAS